VIRKGCSEARVALLRGVQTYERALLDDGLGELLTFLDLTWESLARPGERILLKPNLIRQSHLSRPDEWEQVMTHGALIAAVARRIAVAMEGRGTITIADGPQTDSDFELIKERTGIARLASELKRDFPSLQCRVVDLRREVWRTVNGVVTERRRLPDAPDGYALVDLGDASAFTGKEGKFYGADYDTSFTRGHHSGGLHEYLLARLALDADLFVNLPKLKTHKKVGVTLSLKNLVGINGDKNYLPHFCIGSADEGGDEFQVGGVATALQSRSIRTFKQVMNRFPPAARVLGPLIKRAGAAVFGKTENVVRSGNWYGNDTAWRMVLDLNRILFHFNGDGQRRERPLRYISIVDGIIAGDGNGPMEADAKYCGVLLAGTNPAAVDYVGARLMGFDWQKIPIVREAFQPAALPLVSFDPDDVEVVPALGKHFQFRPHFGWLGHIEAAG
jgi:uncharacterized protein (DUF362 family)